MGVSYPQLKHHSFSIYFFSISIFVRSPGTISLWGLEKEEIGWFLEDLGKATEMNGFLGFNRKYRGKVKVYLTEAGIMRARTRKYELTIP